MEPNLIDSIPLLDSQEGLALVTAPPSPEKYFKLLIAQIMATQKFGINLNNPEFLISDIENESIWNITR